MRSPMQPIKMFDYVFIVYNKMANTLAFFPTEENKKYISRGYLQLNYTRKTSSKYTRTGDMR